MNLDVVAHAITVVDLATRLHLLEQGDEEPWEADGCKCKSISAANLGRIRRASELLLGSSSVPSQPLDPSTSGRVVVCAGKKCARRGSLRTLEEMQLLTEGTGVVVVGCPCMGRCGRGPNATVRVAGAPPQCFTGVGPEHAAIVLDFAAGGRTPLVAEVPTLI